MRLHAWARPALSAFVLSLVTLAATAAGDPPPNRVVLKHEFVDRWESGDLIVHSVNLVLKAIGPGTATDIRVVNVDLAGGSVDVAEHYVDVLASEAVTKRSLRLSYSKSDEPPALFWRVEYTDANGQQQTNVVSAD